MKKLVDYINNNKFDYLDEKLINHLYISYAYNNEHASEYFTFESLGLFNGCKEIVNYILDLDLTKNQEIKALDIPGFTNIYFDKLILNIEHNNKDGVNGGYEIGYNSDEDQKNFEEKRWNKEKNIFNFITINLYNIDDASENDIAEILTHELTHSWDDYILHIESYSSLRNKNLSNKLKNEFETIRQNISSKKVWAILNSDYEKAKELKQKEKYFEKNIQLLIYYLDKFEINAYISQINSIIRGKKFKDIESIVKYIKDNCPTYDNYKYIYDVAFNDNDNEFIKNGATKSQLNRIRKLANAAWKKIINHTYLICVDALENKINEGSSKVFIKDKLTKLWKR